MSVGQPQNRRNQTTTQTNKHAMVMEEAMDGEMSLSNMVLGFFEDFEREQRPEKEDDDDEGSGTGDAAESKAFWQAQRAQLHVSPLLPPFDLAICLAWRSSRSSRCSFVFFSG